MDLGYIIIRSPYTPIFYLLKGDYTHKQILNPTNVILGQWKITWIGFILGSQGLFRDNGK